MIRDDYIPAFQRLLGAAQSQQRALSKNIANQNTPGYRRVEVDFAEVLRDVRNADTIRLKSTSGDHLPSLRTRKHRAVVPEESAEPIEQGRMNNVDLDMEMSNLSKTQLYYMLVARAMRQKFQHLGTSITGNTR